MTSNHSRRSSEYIPDHVDHFMAYGIGEPLTTAHYMQYQYPENYDVLPPILVGTSSRSSFDGNVSPRRQSIRIIDILNLNDEGLQDF
ncbi:hypothetical protein ABW21_db0205709 [Orbilia brochopaga]|nr:hypothetical protein ABW21_db0205709 [Drechslerella brochopaga]